MNNRSRRIMVAAGVIIAALGLTTTLLALRGPGKSSAKPSTSDSTAAVTAPSPAGDPLAQLEKQVNDHPGDAKSLAYLASAYVQRARVTGDPTLYPLADKAVQRSLQVQPANNREALIAQSSLAAGRHNFGAALDWAQKADVVSPNDSGVQAVMGDAFIELGRYPEAFAAFQRMIDLRPDLSGYSRVSYARELQGDTEGAIQALQAALEAAANHSDEAFAEFQLGELYWNSGRVAQALDHYQRAAKLDPSYLPPQAALARAAFFAGHPDQAIKQYTDVTERNPFPQYVGDFADVGARTGNQTLAKQQLAVLAAQDQLFKANGVNVDVELAIFDADHGIDLPGSLAAVQREWTLRQSVVVADSLAWTLHANGRDGEALQYANQALHLGSRNALYLYHRARINQALNNAAAAKADLQQALAINPNFSVLHSGDARQWATELGLR